MTASHGHFFIFDRMKPLVMLACLFLALVFEAQAATRFTNRFWRQESGLPGNDIIALCQDNQGYLWLSTSRTLVRFDGSRFVVVSPEEEELQSPNGFSVLVADRDGSLLLGASAGGVLRMTTNGRFSRHPLPAQLAHEVVTSIFRAKDGALWLGFKGGVALRQHDGKDQVFTFERGSNVDTMVQIVQDGSGRVWLTNGSMLVRFENGALVHVPVHGEEERLYLATARENGPWVISDERLFKVVGVKPVEITKINNYTSAQNLQAFIEDKDGALWLGTRFRGLRRLSVTKGFEQQSMFEQPGDVAAVIQDSMGNLWAGSHGGGLTRTSPALVRMFNRSLRLVENHSLTICQDRGGVMWFANRDGGVFYLREPGRVVRVDRPLNTENFSVISVTPRIPDGIWLTSSHGLFSVDRTLAQPVFVATPFPRAGAIKVSFTARDGSLWLATAPGRLARLKEGRWTEFDTGSGLENLEIRSTAEDEKGTLWFGCAGGKIFLFDGSKFDSFPLKLAQPPGAIQAIHFDAKGDCWIGTERGGLIHYREKIGVVNMNSGLPSNNITNIISDDLGSLWLGTPESIFSVSRSGLIDCIEKPSSRIQPVAVGVDEGVSEASCPGMYQPSVWKSADGRLWFATREGVVMIDPVLNNARQPPPTIRINSVQFDGMFQKNASLVKVPSRVREVSFKYSALCLSTPSRVRTRYKLEGYDYDWTNAPGAETAKYARLPPGRYVLRIEALIAGITDSEATEIVDVEVEASWWQTLWFRILVVVLVFFSVVATVRHWSHRRLRERLARLEHEAALEQERTRIAKNIHDDLGSGLTRISLLTQSSPSTGAEAQMDKIYNTVSELTRSMDEIVWAVNPKNDNLENLAGYLSEFAQSFLADIGLRCRVLLPDQMPRCIVPAQHRHHLFLACKEALNNIAKHAHATEVSVQLSAEGGRLLVVIIDDGRGMPAEGTVRLGNGINNMKSRITAIGGLCEIAPVPGGGTVVKFNFPLSSQTDPCN